MGNKLGITVETEISSKKLKEIFDKYSKGSDEMNKKTALKFLKDLAKETKTDFSKEKGEEVVSEIDPQEEGLDYQSFSSFFLHSTSASEGKLKLSESMMSSALTLNDKKESDNTTQDTSNTLTETSPPFPPPPSQPIPTNPPLNFYPVPPPPPCGLELAVTREKVDLEFEKVCSKVANMVRDSHSTTLASMFGLGIVYASWEDNARNKNSCWGPCISDMTLTVSQRCMPVIRQPNFTDLTWDVPMEKIPLMVGNEADDPLYKVSLKEYLQNIRSFLSKPESWKGEEKSLYCKEKDKEVILSAQACFLPVPKEGDCTFNVSIMNYQSSAYSPAVLAIVATSNGTSAQLITNAGGFNGQK